MESEKQVMRGDDISGWLAVTGLILIVAALIAGLFAAWLYAVLTAL